MKVQSIKFNYALNITRILATTLLGLISMPYINRTLGVESVGKYEFINSIITYFVLFSALGIPTYGIREIAKARDNIKERSKITAELFIILILTNIISYITLFSILYFVESLQENKALIIAIAPIIFFTNLSFEWFFQGIENQLHITIRTVLVKVLTLAAIFYFIDSKDDYVIYALILTLGIILGSLFNLFYLRKYIAFNSFTIKELDIKRHFKGILTIFLASISISIYLQIDNTLLGIYGTETNVGLYTTSNKLIRLAIMMVTTIGAVMLPRLSYLFKNNELTTYYAYLEDSLKYILLISCPLVILMFGLAREIIFIMAGTEFEGSILPMKILCFLIFIVSLSYFFGFMILYPKGKEKIYTIVVFISAVISIILNIIFIPKYFEITTSVVTIIAELLGLLLMALYCKEEIKKIRFFSKDNFFIILSAITMLIPIYLIHEVDLTYWYKIIFSSISGLITYFLMLTLTKNKILLNLVKKIS